MTRIVRGFAALALQGVVAAACLFTVPARADTPAQKKAPTAADFARQSSYLSAKISPSGDSIAVSFWREGVIGLGIVDVKKLKITGSLWFSHGTHIGDYWWASDDRVVMALAKSFGALDQPTMTGELYAMNADGSQKTYLYGYQGESATGTRISGAKQEFGAAAMVAPITGEANYALVGISAWDRASGGAGGIGFWKLDVRNGNKRRVGFINTSRNASYSGEGADVAADVKGELRYALVLGDDGAPIEKRHVASGDGWETVQKHDPAADVRLLGVDDDGQSAYLRIEEDGDRLCTVERNIATGALKTLACDEHAYAGRAYRDVDGRPLIVKQPEGGTPGTAEVIGDGPKARAYRMLLKAFPGQTVTITSGTRDGRRFVVAVGSDRNPGDYYLFDLASKKADYLFSARDWIDPEQMANRLPVDIKARDGLRLHGYLTSRSGLAPEKRPFIILPHGGPHGVSDDWHWDDWPQYLASLGYVVLQVNYRGSGGYGQAFQEAGYREWGGKMQDDLTDSVRWAIDKGIADPARICIMGASYGGYAAVMSAVREPALYRCAIDFAGPVNLVTQSADSDTADFGFGRQYLAKVLGTKDEDLLRNSPITYIDKLRAPVLIAHGTMDRRVPFSQAKELRDAMDRLHKPYVWLPFDGEEHGFYIEANHEKFLLAVKTFLEQNVGPGIASAPAAK